MFGAPRQGRGVLGRSGIMLGERREGAYQGDGDRGGGREAASRWEIPGDLDLRPEVRRDPEHLEDRRDQRERPGRLTRTPRQTLILHDRLDPEMGCRLHRHDDPAPMRHDDRGATRPIVVFAHQRDSTWHPPHLASPRIVCQPGVPRAGRGDPG